MVRTVSIDDFGNRFEHAQSFISDTAAPRLLEAPAAQLFVHAPIDLSWTIDDEDSGVASAQIERRIGSGAWAPVGTPLSAPMGPGASVTLSTQYAPLVEGVLEGSVVEYRVRAWDKAGNPLDLAASTVTTLADYTRPSVTGIFLDTNPQDVTTLPYSRWRITLDDAFSGLANLSLTIETDANGLRDSHANTSANGTATIVPEGNLSLALHELAWLNATATDRAGNTFQLATLAQAAHEILPIIDLTMPRYGRSSPCRSLTSRGSADPRNLRAAARPNRHLHAVRGSDSADGITARARASPARLAPAAPAGAARSGRA